MVNYKSIKLSPGLYFVSTPIGTARDITLRALDILANADVLAAEDTRTLKKLLEIHGIQLKKRSLISYHDHNASKVRPKLLAHLDQGKSIAYASEAGTPLIADPGFSLLTEVLSLKNNVTSAPGPCALIAALTVAGLPTDKFYFEGFLPTNKNQKEVKFRELQFYRGTLIFYESAKRLKDTLVKAAKVFGGDRQGVVCREITKKFEDTRRGGLKELSEFYSDKNVKGEIVLLIAGAVSSIIDQNELEQVLKDALKSMSVKDSADTVANALNVPKRDVYQIALKIKSGGA
ncbi:16S rRNA (cytidine(1402)-2'-O)-methyltransferase [Paracoccaceae bacterium]|nr:16S rRNA (cytidine(1402)-2'-O)-methyltransferase [Paracoccaceae bacterium]